MRTTTRRRTHCPCCDREVATTYGGRIYAHNTGRTDGERCNGSGLLTGPAVHASVTCPTCKGAGVIRPGMVRA